MSPERGRTAGRAAWAVALAACLALTGCTAYGIRLRGGVTGGETVLRRFFDPRSVRDPARSKR